MKRLWTVLRLFLPAESCRILSESQPSAFHFRTHSADGLLNILFQARNLLQWYRLAGFSRKAVASSTVSSVAEEEEKLLRLGDGGRTSSRLNFWTSRRAANYWVLCWSSSHRSIHVRQHQICTYPKLIRNPIVMLSFSDEFAISSNRLLYLKFVNRFATLLIQSPNSEFFSGTNVIVWQGLWICVPIIF